MKRSMLAVIILISMMGVTAFAVPKGLNVPGDLTVTGTTEATGKIFAPNGMNAVGGTVEADHFIGEGSGITNIYSDYSILSATASQAADLNISGQTWGDLIYFNGTNWVRLAPGGSGNTLRSNGVGASPSWGTGFFKSTGSTIETYTAGDDLALDSNAKFYLDSLRTRYLTWNTGTTRFEFNGDLYAGGILGGQFIGLGTSLTSLDASNLTLGVVSTQRGGLGNDISGAAQGSLLFRGASNWTILPPGNVGEQLWTMGTGEAPVWLSPTTGMNIDIINGLKGGPLTTLVGTVEVNFDDTTIGLSGIGSLEVKPGGIDASRLDTGSVTSAAIADGSISASKLATGSVTSGAIALNTITAANMGTDSVTVDAISTDNSPSSGNFLRYNGITMDWATAGSITGSIEVDYITINHNINGSLEVMPGGIDASRLATGSVTSAAIADGAISEADFGTAVVTSGAIASNTITSANLANGSVTSGAIAVGTIKAANMGTNSVTQAAISAGTPGSGNYLRWNGIAMEWANPGTLTGSLEVDHITINHNINGSLEVIDGGITSAKIADNTISAADFANGAVTSGAIALNTVTAANMGTNSVTQAAIAGNSIDGSKLATDINIFTTGYVTAETVRATTFYGSGAGITGVTATTAAYAVLSGTASQAADLNITGQTQGAILFFNGTNWTTLEPGAAGSTLRTSGPGADPTWLAGAVKRVGTTVETYNANDDFALNSGARLFLDNSFSRYLMWDQVATKFQFNGTVSAEGFTGPGSGLTGLNAENISTGTLGKANGGLGIDTSGSGHQGNILYHNGTDWAELTPGTSGFALKTQGPSANPVWGAAGSVTSVGAGRGLTTTTNPITTTGVITIDTLVVVTTSDAQILTNKTINSGLIDGTTSVNTTGIATFGAAATGLFVTNNGYYGGQLAIGESPVFDVTNPEHLRVDAGTSSSVNVISGYGTVNNYLQLNIKNRSNGGSASSDLVATADNGDEDNNYVDLGINSSAYSSGTYSSGPNDTYLLGMGNKLWIGTGNPGQEILFHTGGTTTDEVRMTINGDGLVGIATMEPTATLEVAGNAKIGVGAADPGENGLSVAGTLKVGGGLATTGVVTFEGETYVKASKNLSLGDTTTGASMLLVPFLFTGTVNAGDVVVMTTTANTVSRTAIAGAKDPNVIGFAQRVEGATVYVAVAGRITNAVADNAITPGDVVCTSGTGSSYLGSVRGYGSFQTGKMIGVALTTAAAGGNVSVLIQRF